MFKRLRWTLFGALAGVGGSLWARRRVRRSVERYLPEQFGSDARQWLTSASDDLREAVDKGRAAMAETEAELHARFADRLIAPPVRRGRVIDAEPPAARPRPIGSPEHPSRAAGPRLLQPHAAQPHPAQPHPAQPHPQRGPAAGPAPAGPPPATPPSYPMTTQSDIDRGERHRRRRRR